MILIYYDGSSGSVAAIERAAQLWPGQAATILAVWAPDLVPDPNAWPAGGDAELLDAEAKRAAKDRAKQGVERARNAGLDAEPRVCAVDRTIAKTILSEAHEIGADSIALGTTRLIGRDGVMLGSVSHALALHADLPVLVVPSRRVAAGRSRRGRHEAENRPTMHLEAS